MTLLRVFAVAGAMLTMSAGIALAAEGCECCKDMAAGSAMSCCDKMKAEPSPAPAPAPTPAPEPPSDDPSGQAS